MALLGKILKKKKEQMGVGTTKPVPRPGTVSFSKPVAKQTVAQRLQSRSAGRPTGNRSRWNVPKGQQPAVAKMGSKKRKVWGKWF